MSDCKRVYRFGTDAQGTCVTEGDKSMNFVLGGKGANLAEMSRIGLPVPVGFTITCQTCVEYSGAGNVWPEGALDEIVAAEADLEARCGKKLGDDNDPLLVSVRSGAPFSMPGMMDTVLNLGLNDDSVQGLIAQTQNPRFAWDSYRRFIQMFSNVVMGVDADLFENALTQARLVAGVRVDSELSAEDLQELVETFKGIFSENVDAALYPELEVVDGKPVFPHDPELQLRLAIQAVFGSWMNERACIYRKQHGISDELGTAVNVQAMAFGNKGETSATGVAFTRNPADGTKEFYGDFLVNAQGEDVVAGIRTPQQITIEGSKRWAVAQKVSEEERKAKYPSLEEVMPEVYKELDEIQHHLEQYFKDMQDIEFTIQDGKLWMLQCRNGKRTGAAMVKIAMDMLREGLIDEKTAVLRCEPAKLDELLHPVFDKKAIANAQVITKGLPASPGAATGPVVFFAEDAEKVLEKTGQRAILVRIETSPEDLKGMLDAAGILTARGGMTSHAAVVARGMGKCCVSGCGAIVMDEENKQFTLAGKTYHEGDWLSLDGSTGNIYDGAMPTVDASVGGDFGRIMAWADKYRRLQVRTNADTPHDAAKARELGAQGIGLCRTEHMFFESDRIAAIREMICSDTVEQREKALAKLLPMQQGDFEGIYEAMEGCPVTIRFLDPPLHEFVPTEEADIELLAKDMGKTVAEIKAIIASLHEFNPMMGHRGCRLAVTFPEIAVMQTRAVIRAAINVQKRHPEWNMVPEIMIPLVGEVKELKYVKDIVVKTADELIKAAGSDMKYLVGTMIEIPRAALTADEIAKEAAFFSFGTNDLTQMTFGFSRDDAGKFLGAYYDKKIYENDPFAKLDQKGVGKLVDMACKLGRGVNPDLHLGICGEHGGDPSSVEFCHRTGLDYVSCSPFRVPIARLAAAQAAIKEM